MRIRIILIIKYYHKQEKVFYPEGISWRLPPFSCKRAHACNVSMQAATGTGPMSRNSVGPLFPRQAANSAAVRAVGLARVRVTNAGGEELNEAFACIWARRDSVGSDKVYL